MGVGFPTALIAGYAAVARGAQGFVVVSCLMIGFSLVSTTTLVVIKGISEVASMYQLMGRAGCQLLLAGDEATDAVALIRDAHLGLLRWYGRNESKAFEMAPELISILRASGLDEEAADITATFRRSFDCNTSTCRSMLHALFHAEGSMQFWNVGCSTGSEAWYLLKAEIMAANGSSDVGVLVAIQAAADRGWRFQDYRSRPVLNPIICHPEHDDAVGRIGEKVFANEKRYMRVQTQGKFVVTLVIVPTISTLILAVF